MNDYRVNRQFDHALLVGDLLSSDFGVWIDGAESFVVPAPSYETVKVPGRPGVLLLDPEDPGRFENIDIPYPCFVSSHFPDAWSGFRRALLARPGYQTIRTTHHPGEFRRGYLRADLLPQTGPYNQSGQFTLTFSCQPQRWQDSGAQPMLVPNGGVLANPTGQDALPLITVTGSGAGTLSIGEATLELQDCDGVTMDCQEEDAYRGSENMNLSVSGDFPRLGPGLSTVSWTGGIVSVSVTARWWDI